MGEEEKKSACKISLYTSRERQRELSTRNQAESSSGTPFAGISGAFPVQDRACLYTACKYSVSGFVTARATLSHNSVLSRAVKLITARSWLGRQRTLSTSHVSFSHPLYSSAPRTAVIHARGFAISDWQASTGWNKRLMLFQHPSRGSEKGQQVFDVPSYGVWEAAFPLQKPPRRRRDPRERRSSPEVMFPKITNAAAGTNLI